MAAKIKITSYTDPYCTWCWGSEPIIRHLLEVYGDQIRVEYKMGGLVNDIDDFFDPQNQISTMAQVAPHWREASERHGMPVDESVFLDPANDFKSTYPASIAYKAAEFQSQENANKYLRRLREAAAAEHRFIHKLEVQKELAAEVGLDAELLAKDISGGKAEQAFTDDFREARERGISGFPTFLVSANGDEILLHGYRPYDNFVSIIDKFTGGEVKTSEPKDIFSFIKKWRRVATQEIAEAFNLTKSDAKKQLDELVKTGKIKRQTAGNGWFWYI